MATQTVIFAAPAAQTLAVVRLVKITDDTVFKNASANAERTNGLGIYSATFADCVAADYSIHVQIGSAWLCVGRVFGITNTAATFYEEELIEPTGGGGGGGDCPTAEEVADEVEARFSGRPIVVSDPMSGPNVRLYGNADYNAATGRLVITNATGSGWADMSNGEYDELKLCVLSGGEVTVIGTGEVVSNVAPKSVAFTLTNAEMESLQEMNPVNAIITAWSLKGTLRCHLMTRRLDVILTAWGDA